MRLPRLRRRWIVVIGAVLVVLFATYRALDRPSWIYYYRVGDDRTLVVGTSEAPNAWTRVTQVSETPTTVTITVSSIVIQLGPGAAYAVPVEKAVKLIDPIGNRTVIDGGSGQPVRRTRCMPPAYFAPGCT
jgi:hypothetical protein